MNILNKGQEHRQVQQQKARVRYGIYKQADSKSQ